MKTSFIISFILGLFLSAQAQIASTLEDSLPYDSVFIHTFLSKNLFKIEAEVAYLRYKSKKAINKTKSPHLMHTFLDVFNEAGGKEHFMEYVDLNYGREIDVFLNSGRSFGTGYNWFFVKVPRDSFEVYYDESLSKITYDSIAVKNESKNIDSLNEIKTSELYEFYLNGEKIRKVSIVWRNAILVGYEDTDQFGAYTREVKF